MSADTRWISGGCLCGKVAYELAPPFQAFRYCHCRRCRKATGTAHAANIFVSPAQLRWLSGEDATVRYDLRFASAATDWRRVTGACARGVARRRSRGAARLQYFLGVTGAVVSRDTGTAEAFGISGLI